MSPTELNDDRLYRLRPSRVAQGCIGASPEQRLGELFAIEYDLLLYDVTSTYFEGVAPRNKMARRGYSRDQRADCLQVCIALVVTREGMPLGYEVFEGNAGRDHRQDDRRDDGARYGLAQRIWVMDRGMRARITSWLSRSGRRYLVAAPNWRAGASSWPNTAAGRRCATGWRQAVPAEESTLSFVLCRSTQRRVKEKAMHARFAPASTPRSEVGAADRACQEAPRREPWIASRTAAAAQLARAARYRSSRGATAAGRDTAAVVGARRLGAGGRDSEGSTCCAPTFWTVRLSRLADLHPAHSGRGRLSHPQERAVHTAGVALEGTGCEPHPGMLSGLRAVEDPGAMAVQGRSRQQSAHPARRVRAIRSTDVVLPLAQDPTRELRIRCVVRPDKAQAILLQRLGLRLPERIRIAEDDLQRASQM